ncbi:MAG: hypothetical protein H6631_14880 [Anaerolineaceae bacterium]|nr:hypothetical protein [Anaerolineaceae bacterium]MCB9098998.1 hypothetical protein [Anaerolineales bacterium]
MAEFIVDRFNLPKVYQEFLDQWQSPAQRQLYLEAYQQGRQSFIPGLLPEQAVALTGQETLAILRRRWGDRLEIALDPAQTDPDHPPAQLPTAIQSPVAGQPDGRWLKQTNMVGINVRTVGSFWHIVKYALTLPQAQDSIHILPIWEAGVVGSMYGLSSWELNPEFFSPELADLRPELNTIDKQLRAVINILHVMGKTVGMDVIPHTDRFSQIALAFPAYFEWLQRQDTIIVDHSAELHREVEYKIFEFLAKNGPAVAGDALPATAAELFGANISEGRRLRLLFGPPKDHAGREARRVMLVRHLYGYGYEPAPGTMAPPYRGLKVDNRNEARIVDAVGQVWRDYLITKPEPMSRVFGPLGRYKLYERLDDNRHWAIDFSRPRQAVWQYVCDKYAQVQRRYGFDFMRGDMAHVQMRPAGVPDTIDGYYDILGAVKNYIRQEQGVAYFGYFAETFLAPRNVMTYGEELDHLEASDADTTLGDLQSTVVGSKEFLQRFNAYLNLLETRSCAPCFTLMTADKDDPRFDEFYRQGNGLRLFIGLFLTSMSSYMGLGFETRDVHYQPAPNEHYSKLFVFQESEGPKATHGSFVWGKNGHLYSLTTRLRLYADHIWANVAGRPVRWLIRPDALGESKLLAWTHADDQPDYLFVANGDVDNGIASFGLPLIPGVDPMAPWQCQFSTADYVSDRDQTLIFNGKHYKVNSLAPGEGRVYVRSH